MIVVDFWNLQKGLWSLLIFLTFGLVTPHAEPLALATPAAVGAYVCTNLPYMGDPWKGLVDFNHAPSVLQGAIETNTARRLAIDCDDFGVLAYAMLAKIPGCKPYLYTLIDQGGVGCHVITLYDWNKPRGGVEHGAIDTSGWRELATLTPAVVLPTWTALYARVGYRYVGMSLTRYPF